MCVYCVKIVTANAQEATIQDNRHNTKQSKLFPCYGHNLKIDLFVKQEVLPRDAIHTVLSRTTNCTCVKYFNSIT